MFEPSPPFPLRCCSYAAPGGAPPPGVRGYTPWEAGGGGTPRASRSSGVQGTRGDVEVSPFSTSSSSVSAPLLLLCRARRRPTPSRSRLYLP